MNATRFLLAAVAMPFAVASAQQQVATAERSQLADSAVAKKDSGSADGALAISTLKPIVIQHLRANDQRGINVFEPPKDNDRVAYTGFKLDWGAGFTQQFQGLQHENRATPVMVAGVNTNQLLKIGNGFNNAAANLYINAQVPTVVGSSGRNPRPPISPNYLPLFLY